MWSLVVDELLNKLTSTGPHCIWYADDIVIVAKGKYDYKLESNSLKDHCHEADCKSSQNHCCTIHKKKVAGKSENPNHNANSKQEVTFPGITLDYHQLLWNKHIQETISKATRPGAVTQTL